MQPRFGDGALIPSGTEHFVVLICTTLLLCACGGDSGNDRDGGACTLELRPGIVIEVLDAMGAAASCGAQAVITEGQYSETVQNPSVPCIETLLLSGAHERPGAYTVRVSKPGFADVVFADVAVTKGVCHVNTVALTAKF